MSDTAEAQQTITRSVCILGLTPIKGTNRMSPDAPRHLQNHCAVDSAQEGSASGLHGSTNLKGNRLGLKGALQPLLISGLEHNYLVKLWFGLC